MPYSFPAGFGSAMYDSIFKSEKASYLLLRKTFDDLYELIEKGNQSRKANVEDIIHAQKAVAKVSIGRSKENADALMNSNDHIMEKISMLYSSMHKKNVVIMKTAREIHNGNKNRLNLPLHKLFEIGRASCRERV